MSLAFVTRVSNIVSDLKYFPQHSSYLLVSNVNLKQIYSTVPGEHFEMTWFTLHFSLTVSWCKFTFSWGKAAWFVLWHHIYYISSPHIPLLCHVINTAVLLIYTFLKATNSFLIQSSTFLLLTPIPTGGLTGTEEGWNFHSIYSFRYNQVYCKFCGAKFISTINSSALVLLLCYQQGHHWGMEKLFIRDHKRGGEGTHHRKQDILSEEVMRFKLIIVSKIRWKKQHNYSF